jgi:integrase
MLSPPETNCQSGLSYRNETGGNNKPHLGQVDLNEGFIRLHPRQTRGALSLLPENWWRCSRPCPGAAGVNVVTFKGRSITYIKVGFVKACKRARIQDFTFHNLRHTAINNWRLAGHDYFRIMASGQQDQERFQAV